ANRYTCWWTAQGPSSAVPGEWLVEKHASRTRRSWRKLHIGVDADTGEIIAADLTNKDVDDGSQVGPLLEQIAGPVASFTGDGAYDRDDVYREVCQRHPDAAVIVPPRSSAVPSATAEPHRRSATGTCSRSPSAAAWAGSGHLVTIGVPWWRPISGATSE